MTEAPLFHGSRYRLTPGQVLVGGAVRSNQGYGQPGEHVYASTRADVAADFAHNAYGPDGDCDAVPHVYLVEAVTDLEDDPLEESEFGCYRAVSMRVVREVRWATLLA